MKNLVIEDRNGTPHIGVVVSTHRIGWSTWNGHRELATDPTIVKLVQSEAPGHQVVQRAIEIRPDGHYVVAMINEGLQVKWVPTDIPFRVVSDDRYSAERIETYRKEEWICG